MLQAVVGFSTDAHGPQLAACLLRSLLLLALLRLYRFGFAVGTAQVKHQHTAMLNYSDLTQLFVLICSGF